MRKLHRRSRSDKPITVHHGQRADSERDGAPSASSTYRAIADGAHRRCPPARLGREMGRVPTADQVRVPAQHGLWPQVPFEHRDLVAEHEDLRIPVLATHGRQPQQGERVGDAEVGQSKQHGESSSPNDQRRSEPDWRRRRRHDCVVAVKRPSPARMRFSAPAARGGWQRRSNFNRRAWQPAINTEPVLVPGMHFHDLRHSHKMWLIEDGIPEIAQARRLGHRLAGVRGIYSHVTEAMVHTILTVLQNRWESTQPTVSPATRPALTLVTGTAA